MAIVIRPASVAKTSTDKTMSLNIDELKSLIADTYYKNQNNWKVVRLYYKHESSNQVMSFEFFMPSIYASFKFNQSARLGMWNVQKIMVCDYDNGYVLIDRFQLPNPLELDFNLTATEVSGGGGNGVTVNAGETRSIVCGSTNTFDSLTINTGGCLELTPGDSITFIDVAGDLVLNGDIYANNGYENQSATWTAIAPNGDTVVHDIVSQPGGKGGDSWWHIPEFEHIGNPSIGAAAGSFEFGEVGGGSTNVYFRGNSGTLDITPEFPITLPVEKRNMRLIFVDAMRGDLNTFNDEDMFKVEVRAADDNSLVQEIYMPPSTFGLTPATYTFWFNAPVEKTHYYLRFAINSMNGSKYFDFRFDQLKLVSGFEDWNIAISPEVNSFASSQSGGNNFPSGNGTGGSKADENGAWNGEIDSLTFAGQGAGGTQAGHINAAAIKGQFSVALNGFDGVPGVSAGAGGAKGTNGQALWIRCRRMFGNGTIYANGGKGGDGGDASLLNGRIYGAGGGGAGGNGGNVWIWVNENHATLVFRTEGGERGVAGNEPAKTVPSWISPERMDSLYAKHGVAGAPGHVYWQTF